MQLAYITIGLIFLDQLIDRVPFIQFIYYYGIYFRRTCPGLPTIRPFCLKRRIKECHPKRQRNISTQHQLTLNTVLEERL